MRTVYICLLLLVLTIRIFSLKNSQLEGRTIRLQGVVREDAQTLGSSQYFHLGNYVVFLNQDTLVEYASKVTVEGEVHDGAIKNAKLLEFIPSNSFLSRLHKRALHFIQTSVPEPEASLIAGISFGSNQIQKSFKDILRNTGTSHIIVASGGNLAILGGFLEVIFSRFLKRKTFIPLNGIILFLYSVFVGLGAPIVRAYVMWLVVSFAQFTGRLISPTKALFYTIFCMILIKPNWFFDVSFWLSVLSTGGIVLLQKRLAKVFSRLPIIGGATATTLAAQIGVLPISLFVFGNVTPLAPLWNLLVGWTVPYIQALGMLSVLCALLFEPLGKVFLYSTYPLAWYFKSVLLLS